MHKSKWKSVGSLAGLREESHIVLSGLFPNQSMTFAPGLNCIRERNAAKCSVPATREDGDA